MFSFNKCFLSVIMCWALCCRGGLAMALKVSEVQRPAELTLEPVASVRHHLAAGTSTTGTVALPPATAPLSGSLFPKGLEALQLAPLQNSHTLSPGKGDFPSLDMNGPFFSGELASGGSGRALQEGQRRNSRPHSNLVVTICFFIKQSLPGRACRGGSPRRRPIQWGTRGCP